MWMVVDMRINFIYLFADGGLWIRPPLGFDWENYHRLCLHSSKDLKEGSRRQSVWTNEDIRVSEVCQMISEKHGATNVDVHVLWLRLEWNSTSTSSSTWPTEWFPRNEIGEQANENSSLLLRSYQFTLIGNNLPDGQIRPQCRARTNR